LPKGQGGSPDALSVVMVSASDRFEDLLERLAQSAGEASARSGDDARLLGRAFNSLDIETWLHIVYPPLTDTQISDLEQSLDRTLPGDYERFLRRANGIDMFTSALAIYGLRTDYSRSPEVFQPFSVVEPNQFERPQGMPETLLVIGSYCEDGSLVASDGDGKIWRTDRDDFRPLNTWPDLFTMLLTEVERLEPLFAQPGLPKYPHAVTAPPPSGDAASPP
jgi:SMI1 / KNR4 family (SUKH-1)